MVWFKVDDLFLDHPKHEAGGYEEDPERWARAISVWLAAGLYCARHLTDGAFSARALRRLVPVGVDVNGAVRDLVRAGLVKKVGKKLLMHDYLKHQPSRRRTLAKRQANRLRQQRLRDGKTVQSPTLDEDDDDPRNGVTNGVTNGVSHNDVTASVTDPRPDPTRPDPTNTTHAEDARVSANVGSQLGAEVCRWLGSHLGKSFNAASEVVTDAGQDWRSRGWAKVRVIGAVKLRVAQLKQINPSRCDLTPALLFDEKLVKWIEQFDAGGTVGDYQTGKNGQPAKTKRWKTVDEAREETDRGQ